MKMSTFSRRSLAALALATVGAGAPAAAQNTVPANPVAPVPTPNPALNPAFNPGVTPFDPRVSGFDPRFSAFDPRSQTFFNPNIGPGTDPFFNLGAFNDPFVRGAAAVTGNPFITSGLTNPGFFGGFGGWPGFGGWGGGWFPAGASAMGYGSLSPKGFGPGGPVLVAGFRPNPPPPPATSRQRVRNVRVIEDGPGAATASAPLGTPGSPAGNSATGARETRAATAVVGVPSEQTVVAGSTGQAMQLAGGRQGARNVRVIQDGPGAATAGAPLGTPGSSRGNSAIGAAETRAATSVVGVPSERTVVAPPDYQVSQRMVGLMRTRAMLPARVVSVGATGVRVRVTTGGRSVVRRYSLPNVFFYKGERLYDADGAARMLKRNDTVLVPEGLGEPV